MVGGSGASFPPSLFGSVSFFLERRLRRRRFFFDSRANKLEHDSLTSVLLTDRLTDCYYARKKQATRVTQVHHHDVVILLLLILFNQRYLFSLSLSLPLKNITTS